MAITRGYTHLLHIDDDELLHCPSGVSRFRNYIASMDYDAIQIRNIEAVYEASDCINPFESTRIFTTSPPHFSAYANGKSIANLRRRQSQFIRPIGPHQFSGTSRFIPSCFCVIAHYESGCIKRWQQKFSNYALDTPSACQDGEIPFQYYCESIASQTPNVWRQWKSPARHDAKTLVELDILRYEKLLRVGR